MIWSQIPFPSKMRFAEVYKLPNLPSMCPEKSADTISPGFQEAKDSYEEWIKETLGYSFLIVCSTDVRIQSVLIHS